MRALGCALLVSCHGGAERGRLLTSWHDAPFECEPTVDGEGEICIDEFGQLVHVDVLLEGFAFLSLHAAEEDDGLLVYGELPLPEFRGMGFLEIDVSRTPLGVDVQYVERNEGEEVFRATRVSGQVQIPEDLLGEQCWCETGRIELRLEDPGPDGELDTADDLVRHLSRGRFTRGEELCVDAIRYEIEPGVVNLDVVDRCPSAGISPPMAPSTPPPSGGGSSGGSSGSASCEADGSSCSGGDSASCDGDGASCDGGGSGGGASCDGDSGATCSGDAGSSCSGGGSGCGGGGSSTCVPDAAGDDDAVVPACRMRSPGGCGVHRDGRVQFLFFLFVVLFDMRRRAGPLVQRLRL